MFKLPVEIVSGKDENGKPIVMTVNETVYDISDRPFDDMPYTIETVRKKGKHPCTYYNVSAAFDIESTTIEPDFVLKNGKKNYITNPFAYMYQWQFCLNDTVIFGRTWEQFVLLLAYLEEVFELSESKRLVVYVHSLMYEFQFMKDFIHIQSMFCKDKRKPLKILTTGGIEFRCSYFLSNMSLIKFCENSRLCKHYKLADTYDYRILRTPDTPYFSEDFSATDLAYCYNDVRGLCECIDTMLLEDTIVSIPLTNTGYVRRDFRSAMQANEKNHWLLNDTRLDAHLYELLRWLFRGGNTHASRYYANQILTNVKSKDLQSSYPACMMLDEYPMGRFKQCYNVSQAKLNYHIKKNNALIIWARFYNVRVKGVDPFPYIDISHCRGLIGAVNDNGRVLKADTFEFCMNELDYKIIRDTYDYDGFEIIELWYTHKAKLPKEFRERLLYWYDGKTQLKGIDGKAYEYLKSKNRINSAFGMMVSDIAHSSIEYDPETMDWSETKPDIQQALDEFYRSRNSFLPYQWGVWVTSLARYRLQEMINVVGLDGIYIDTDSLKYINHDKWDSYFDAKNKEILQQCEDNDMRAYSEKDGKKYYLGIWDDDGTYKRFKTLGAKKYAYEDDGLHITVSGMSKSKGVKAVGTIENFNIGTTYSDIGRTTSWYNDERPHEITVNDSTFTTASNIGVLDTTYTLGVSKEYWEILMSVLDTDVADIIVKKLLTE